MADDEFMTIVPMLCHSCATPLANKQIMYEEYIKTDSFEAVMERIGIRRYCCRMHFTSPSNIPYGGPDKPYGSIAEYTVSPDIIQVWAGVMSRAPIKESVPPQLIDEDVGAIETVEPVEEGMSLFKGASQPLTFGELKSPVMRSETFGSALEQLMESTPSVTSGIPSLLPPSSQPQSPSLRPPSQQPQSSSLRPPSQQPQSSSLRPPSQQPQSPSLIPQTLQPTVYQPRQYTQQPMPMTAYQAQSYF